VIVANGVLAIDGHDGSGKTTVARKLAAELGAAYVRPFSGNIGGQFLAAAEAGRAKEAIQIAAQAVDKALQAHAGANVIVCDRLWITVASVVPDTLLGDWTIRSPTLICWADLEATLARLASRNEPPQPIDWHQHYLNRYADLSTRFDCPIVRTDQMTENEVFRKAFDWARAELVGLPR
jgi:thymidylate kinase